MKKINLLMVALIGAMTLTLTSCDECKDVTCENGGTCTEGVCECADNYYGDACETQCVNGTYASGTCGCDAGFEGDACDTESRTNWVGDFNGDDNCGFTYESTISNGTESDEVNISNFAGFDVSIVGSIANGSDLTIDTQTDASGRVFSGTGTLASTGNTVTLNYTVEFDDGTSEDCVITYTRK